MVAAGDHRGEKIFIRNRTRRVKQIQNSERIAHGLLVRAPEIEFIEVSQDEVAEVHRADPEMDKPSGI